MGSKESKVCYIALDPGETTGWAKFNSEGELLSFGQYTQAEQNKWLADNITPDLLGVVTEEYRNYHWKKQRKWSRNQTSKNEGAIEMVCALRNVPCHLQPANIKVIGYKWAGLKQAPSNHAISHQYDAVAHGTYWLTMNDIRNPMLNVHD